MGTPNQNVDRNIFDETAEALANLAHASTSDRKALETLSNTVSNLSQQVQAKDQEIEKLKEELKKSNKRTKNPKSERKDNGSYCHSHGYLVHEKHNSENCRFPKDGHIRTATRANNMGGSQEGKP